MTSVAVHQYTYQHVGRWTQHANPSRGLFGTHRTSVGVRQQSAQTGRLWVSVSTHKTFRAVRVCPSAHTGRLTHRTSVGVRQHTQDVCGCPCVSVCDRQHTQDDVRGCQWLSVSTHRTSMCVRQHTQDVRVCLCVSVAHTGRPWLSISTHMSTLVLGLSTLALPVDCLGNFGPRGLSVQYTHDDVRGCPPAHTGRSWLSVCVRVCSSVSVSTHRTSVAIHQYTYQHVGPWTQHAGPSHGLFG
ncbi:unnamed protein product [Brassica rapa]|uniref:Uncharacterized protein n=1 Tax=Brassica campestris TaxID=3711 RepID=A0A8D9CRM3_BRACM|nr:unnamed protein product [Brassica rapa]